MASTLTKLITEKLGGSNNSATSAMISLIEKQVLHPEQAEVYPILASKSYLIPISVVKYSDRLVQLLSLSESEVISAAKKDSPIVANFDVLPVNIFRADFLVKAVLVSWGFSNRNIDFVKSVFESMNFQFYEFLHQKYFGKINAKFDQRTSSVSFSTVSKQMESAERYIMSGVGSVGKMKISSYVTLKNGTPLNLIKLYVDDFLDKHSSVKPMFPIDTYSLQVNFIVRPLSKLNSVMKSYRNLLGEAINAGCYLNLESSRPTDAEGNQIVSDASDVTSKIATLVQEVLQKFGKFNVDLGTRLMNFGRLSMSRHELELLVTSSVGDQDSLATVIHQLLNGEDGTLVNNIRSVSFLNFATKMAKASNKTNKEFNIALDRLLKVSKTYRNSSRPKTLSDYRTGFLLYLAMFIQKLE